MAHNLSFPGGCSVTTTSLGVNCGPRRPAEAAALPDPIPTWRAVSCRRYLLTAAANHLPAADQICAAAGQFQAGQIYKTRYEFRYNP